MANELSNEEPGDAGLRERARALSGLALDTLAAIMEGKGADTARLAAAREVLDRGYGKTRPGVEDEDDGDLTWLAQRYDFKKG